MCKTVRNLIEFAVTQRIALEGQRECFGCALHLGGKQCWYRYRGLARGLVENGPITPLIQGSMGGLIRQTDR
ncbi:hypothetical protein MSIMFI_05550 [Mycobacterium simulans]|nr:hypothetical protein MSIMFI_05550 [Mycobacterium simulans]